MIGTTIGHRLLQGIFGLMLLASVTPVRGAVPAPNADSEPTATWSEIPLLSLRQSLPVGEGAFLDVNPVALAALRTTSNPSLIRIPLSPLETVAVELQPFEVLAPTARFWSAGPAGQFELPRPDVFVARGRIHGEPDSLVFLSFSVHGPVNGYVQRSDGTRYFMSRASKSADAPVAIHRDAGLFGAPDSEEFCGLHETAAPIATGETAARAATLYGGPMLAHVAVDADQFFVNLFDGDELAAQAYIAQVMAAVSDIYVRDLDMRLVLSFVRTWPNGGEPFVATDLGGFANYWQANEDMTGLNYVHMFSGSRNTTYGGIAYLTSPCNQFAFGISSILLGSFPQPVGPSNLGNWDVVVVAHEMGHNSGTGHTHDSYSPPIDQCGTAGISSRSDIMSYCHTTPGGLLNTDMRFHRRVQDVVAATTQGTCLGLDCNGNAVNDAEDIAALTSTDLNFNGIPDECEDCNGNGVLDPIDIAGGAPDLDSNAIPDVCEADCNANGIPDKYEIAQGLAIDENGNQAPDECDPDCDGDGTADHAEILAGIVPDIDRNTVGDNCQDCDGNGVVDYIDVGRSYHVFVAQLADNVREYHRASGVGVRTLGAGAMLDPYDAVFGPDRQLYVASFGDDRIVRVDVDAGTSSTFVAAGSGGLNGPSGLTFGPNGNLFVSSNLTNSVLEFDGTTGAFVQTFVTSGSGGLVGPFGLAFGPLGRLYVAGSDNAVRRYDGFNGSFVNVFVAAGSGGLSGPRGIAFSSNNRLFVASFNNSSVLEYSSAGAFVRNATTGIIPNGAWGVRVGPNGNLFVGRNTGQIRILEYDIGAGRYLRSFIRGDNLLTSPTGFDFRPQSPLDCNANFTVDLCDVTSGVSADCQANSIPDECDLAAGTSTDINGSGVPDECECVQLTPVPVETLGACATSAQCSGVSTCIGGRCYGSKNRYLSIAPGGLAPGETFGIRVRHPASGRTWWVNAHQAGDPVDVYRLGVTRTCQLWDTLPSVIHLTDCGIVPDDHYEVQALHCACPETALSLLSPATTVPTTPDPNGPAVWGDCTGGFDVQSSSWLPPNGFLNITDIQAAVIRFQNPSSGPPLVWIDIHGDTPNALINVSDIQQFVLAFQGQAYPNPLPGACP